MRLDGIGVFVNDMKTMVDFYKNTLKFEIEWDGKEPNVMLKKDGTLFMFYGRNNFEKMTKKRFSYANGINGHYEIIKPIELKEAIRIRIKRIHELYKDDI